MLEELWKLERDKGERVGDWKLGLRSLQMRTYTLFIWKLRSANVTTWFLNNQIPCHRPYLDRYSTTENPESESNTIKK